MDSIKLVEVRKADTWHVAAWHSENETHVFVYIDSITEVRKYPKKDSAEFRTNTAKDQGLNLILKSISFIYPEWVTKIITVLKNSKAISLSDFNHFIRGKIYICLIQLLEFCSAYENNVDYIYRCAKEIFEFYSYLMTSKIRIEDSHNFVNLLCLPEIESVFRNFLGLDEPGKTFLELFKGKLPQEQKDLDLLELDEYAFLTLFLNLEVLVMNFSNSLEVLPLIDIYGQFLNRPLKGLSCEPEVIRFKIKDFLEKNLNLNNPKINISSLNISMMYTNLTRFEITEKKICSFLFDLLNKPLKLTQKLQVFHCLDNIKQEEFKLQVLSRKNINFIQMLLEQESFVKYIMKYIRVSMTSTNIQSIFSDIIKSINSREVLNSFIKVVTTSSELFKPDVNFEILSQVLSAYSIDCRQSIIEFISSLLFNFTSNIWSQIYDIVYNKIKKPDEAIHLFKCLLGREKNLILKKNILEEIMEKTDDEKYAKLALALIESSELVKLEENLEGLRSRTLETLKNCLNILPHLKFLEKFMVIRKDCLRVDEFLNVDLFKKSLKNIETFDIFAKLAKEVDINKLNCIDQIIQLLINFIEKDNHYASAESLLLVLFLKYNEHKTQSLIILSDFWKREKGFLHISRKSKKDQKVHTSLEYEDEFLNLYFNSKIKSSIKSIYKEVILSLYTKFDTSADWTKQIKSGFLNKFLTSKNSIEKLELFENFIDEKIELNDQINLKSLISTVSNLETNENLFRLILLIRKLLFKINDSKFEKNEVFECLKSNICNEFKVILIERTLRFYNRNEFEYYLKTIIENINSDFSLGQIIFYVLSQVEEINFSIDEIKFDMLLNFNQEIYKFESKEEKMSFDGLFSHLCKFDCNHQAEFLTNLIMIIIKNKMNLDVIYSKISQGFESHIIIIVAQNIMTLIIRGECLRKFELIDESDKIFQFIFKNDSNSQNYFINLVFLICKEANDNLHLANLIKLVLFLVESPDFRIDENDENVKTYLESMCSNLLNFNSTNPLILDESIKSQAILLLTKFNTTRYQFVTQSSEFLENFQSKLLSKKLNYNIKTEDHPKSLKNFGSTCYINTVLQLIYKIKPFKYSVLNYSQADISLNALKSIFQRLKFSIRKSVESKKFINFYELYEDTHIDKMIQGDASEFFENVFYKIIDIDSVLKNAIAFKVSKVMTCECKEKKISEEEPKYLNFNLAGEEKITDLIESYKKVQELDESNFILCESCNSKSIKSFSHEFDQLPPYLICMFNRFKFNIATQATEKVTDECIIEHKIIVNDLVYELELIINHFGNAVEGHYVTYKKRKGNWYEIDDKSVTLLHCINFEDKSTFPDNCKLKKEYTPYIVLYRKSEITPTPKPELNIDQSVQEKNLMYIKANFYCGEPMIKFLSNAISYSFEYCLCFLFNSLPYQQIDPVTLIRNIYRVFDDALNDESNRKIFIENLKSYYFVHAIRIFSGFSSNDFKLVLSTLIIKAFTGKLDLFYSLFAPIFGLDNSKVDLTYIIEFFVLMIHQNYYPQHIITNLFNFFIYHKLPDYQELQLGLNFFGFTNFSVLFKYLYSHKDYTETCDNFLSLENFKLFSSFSTFQQNPKWYSKLMSKKVKMHQEELNYLTMIKESDMNLEIKRRLLYDLINQIDVNSSIFRDDCFRALLRRVREAWINIKLLEKICFALSIKLYLNKREISECLRILVENDGEIDRIIHENLRKGAIENFDKLKHIVDEILRKNEVVKKSKMNSEPGFWNMGFKAESYGELDVVEGDQKELIIVRSDKIW